MMKADNRGSERGRAKRELGNYEFMKTGKKICRKKNHFGALSEATT